MPANIQMLPIPMSRLEGLTLANRQFQKHLFGSIDIFAVGNSDYMYHQFIIFNGVKNAITTLSNSISFKARQLC